MFHHVASNQRELRRRLLVLLGVSLLTSFAIFILIAYLELKSDMRHELDAKVQHVQHLYGVLIEQRKELLEAKLETVVSDAQFIRAFKQQDRTQLQKLATPLFKHLSDRHHISHFYFHTPEGLNFLRLHQPHRYGDRIDRHTLREAKASREWRAGIELGPLGTYTLRYVAPWYADGELIGFVELGEEFQPLVDEAALTVGVQMLVMIDKELLDRESWQAGMRMLSRESEWEMFPDTVVVDETRPGLARALYRYALKKSIAGADVISVSVADENYVGRSLPLLDVAGQEVGQWYVLNNVSASLETFHATMFFLIVLLLVIGMVLLGVFNRVLRRIESELWNSYEKLEHLVDERTRELQQALNEVEINREQIRVVLKSLHDPILVVDDESRVWLANRSARDLFRLGDASLTSYTLSELLDGELCKRLEAMPPASHEAIEVDIERLQAGKQQRATFAVQTTTVALGDGSHAYIFMFHDVTRARQLERLKSEFISNAAHELNTPLATVVGYSELLLDPEQDFSEETRREFLHTIYQKANHLNYLLAQILDISRLEAGRPIPLEIEEFSLQEKLDRVLKHLPLIHPRHQFNMVLPESPALITADPGKFLQIMENLLSNAVKYSPQGGEISLQVVYEEPDRMHFSVEDHGVGMSHEEAAQAFERFYRVDASDSATRGVGLGLTITRQLIESHGGRIWLESRPGEGTNVHFTLPGRLQENLKEASAH